ncbi:hypothetical protein Tco_1392022, partial [Tanacetum coccineum]
IALESLESRILGHEKNELAWGEKYEFQNYDLKCLNLELEKVVKERDELKLKIEKWEGSSKNLTKILNSQMSTHDKNGLGFGTQMDDLSNKSKTDSENSLTIFEVRFSDGESTLANNRFTKANKYHVVPPPITRNPLTPRANISFAGLDEYAFRNKIIESKTTETNKTVGNTNEATITSDDEDDVCADKTVSSVKPNVTQAVRSQADKSGQTSQKQGIGFKKVHKIKACFVCKSTGHLIKDYDFYDQKSPEPRVKNVVNTRKREVKLVSVLTRAGLVNTDRSNVSTARPLASKIAQSNSVIRPNHPRLDIVRPKASNSPIKRSYVTQLFYRPKDLKPDVKTFGIKNMTIVGTRVVVSKGKVENVLKKDKWVWRPKMNYQDHVYKYNGSYMLKKFEYGNLEILLQDHAVVDSGCSCHMTGNKAYHSDYEDLNGGFVAIGSDPKGVQVHDKHNMVAFLKKPNKSVGFTEVVDFLKGTSLRYALTHNPTIYDSLVKQFWQTATVRTLANGTQQLVASIDSKEYTITEASVRSKLQLADATGIHNLSDAKIYAGLATLGYVTEGDIVSLLPVMLEGAAVDQGEGSAQLAEPHHTHVDPISSTSPPHPSPPHPSPLHPSPLHQSPLQSPPYSPPHLPPHLPPHSPPHSPPQSPPHFSPPRSYEVPLPECNTSGSAEDSVQLKELMVLVPTLVTRINSLEKELKETKQTLGNVVLKLVKKVKSLETALKSKSKQVLISESEGEESEDRGRKIQDIDDDPLVSLVRESMKEKSTYFVTLTEATEEAQKEENQSYNHEALKHCQRLLLRCIARKNQLIRAQNTGEDKGQRKENAPMLRGIQATHKTKEQMRQEEAGLEAAIKAKLEANAKLTKDVLGKDLPEQDFAKRMVDMIKEEFDKLVQQIDTFVPINLEATKAKLKRYREELQIKTLKKQRFDDKDVPVIGEKVVLVKEEEQVPKKKKKEAKVRKGIKVTRGCTRRSETDKEESVEVMNPTLIDYKTDSSSGKDKGPTQEYILFSLQPHGTRIPVKDVVQDAHEQPSENASPNKGIQVLEDVFDKEGQHQMPKDEQVWQDELEIMVTQELVANAMNDESGQAFEEEKRRIASQKKAAQATSTNQLNTDRPFSSTDRSFVSIDRSNTPNVSAASTSTCTNADESLFVYLGGKIPIDASTLPNVDLPIDPNMLDLEDASDILPNDGIFNGAYDDDEDVGAVVNFNNMDHTIAVSPIPTLKIHKDHPKGQILGGPTSAVQTRIMRANRADTVYMSFGAMVKDFTREDLIELYMLVMQKYGTNRPEDAYDRVLWSDLRTMFDPPLNKNAIWSLHFNKRCKLGLESDEVISSSGHVFGNSGLLWK